MILLTDEEIVVLIANREMSGRFLTTGEGWDIIKKAQLKKVSEWGDEDCPHAGYVLDNAVLHKRECSKCWQELEED